MKKVVQDLTSGGIDWQREKWQSGLGSKFIHQGEKNAVKYADEVIVLSKGLQDYFKEIYGRKTHFIPNGVNRPQTREANLITDKFGLKKDSYILFLGRLVPEKGIRYLVEAFKNVKTDKKLVIAGGSSDTDSFMEELKELAKGDDRILFTGFVQGAMLDELYSNAYIYTLPSDLEGMPLSLLEAMSYGNCCLVSDIPECAEVVEDKALIFQKSNVQISYIKEYINHRDDLMLLDVFADKRCTGTNFDCPEFERLLKALQERKVNCIVVKDFSRLGRNFVETGQYLEQVFPLFGVRFIAINDNYDSLNSQSRDGMLVPIKSMINEMYSKDLSQKIQSCFRSKEARGEIYTPVPFGYKRNQQNHLVLDEEVSDVVMRIFLWKKSGMKEREIAKKLSAQGIQTPFTRRCQLGYLKNTLRVKDPAWQTVFVTKVLENPVYTGTMVYNRIAYDETYRKTGENPRESWQMVPDSHPAIISWELFDEVSALREAEQAVKEERKKWCRQRRKNNPNIFKGRIFCKKCGEKLVCHWQSDGTLYFYCASCHVSISEKDLWNGINKELHQRMEEHRDLQNMVRKSSGKSKLQSKEITTKRKIEQVMGNVVRLESQKRSGYEQYVLGKLSKEKFFHCWAFDSSLSTMGMTVECRPGTMYADWK